MAVPIANAAAETTVVLAAAGLNAKPVAVSSDDRVVFQVVDGLRSVRADGTEPRTLATTAVTFHASTKDDRIIFSDLYALYAMQANANGPSEAVKIAESMNAAYNYGVSISDQIVAFAKADVLGIVDLSVSPPKRTVLASGGFFQTPSLRDSYVFYGWRPDEGHNVDLYVIRSDGTGKVQLTRDDGPGESGEGFCGLTADGRVIYERVGSGFDVHSVKLDGTDHIQLGLDPASFIALTANEYVVYNDGSVYNGPIRSVRADGSDSRFLGDGGVLAVTDTGYVAIKPASVLAQSASVSVVGGGQVELENFFQDKIGVTSNGRFILGGIPSGGGVQLYSISPYGAARSWLPTTRPGSPAGFDEFIRVVPVSAAGKAAGMESAGT
jgi:hypothetical protein